MVKLRRLLIDKVAFLLTQCDLFAENAMYPSRYFDDLMIEEKKMKEYVGEQEALKEMPTHSKATNFVGSHAAAAAIQQMY